MIYTAQRCLAVGIGAMLLSATVNAQTLNIATVDNADLVRMQELSSHFTQANPDIKLEWITLDENALRQRVTTDIATGAGNFDVFTIGTYEAPIWAERGWLASLNDLPGSYDVADLIGPVRQSLSYENTLYAAPFYGESAFTMYRTDLFEKADIEMPDRPTWDFIKYAASTINDSENGVYGICLRGKPGWGENMALITAMANAYGARWFDEDWQPQLNSKAWETALSNYIELLSTYGPPNADENGYSENLQLFKNGKCGIWVDATVAASAVTDSAQSEVADNVGFAMAPDQKLDKQSNWLWVWALAVSSGSEQQEAAKKFVAWATSKEYIELVAKNYGWSQVPPGTRTSLYEHEEYLQAAPFAELTLHSIESANLENPTVDPVPYKSIQYVSIPEFQSIGTAVGHQIAKALKGDVSVAQALEDSQWVTGKVVEQIKVIAAD